MPTIDRRFWSWILGSLAIVGAALCLWSLRGTPQLGGDEAVYKTVDALFTAVTARDAKRLDECERRLHVYRESGALPAKAAGRLDGVIATAKSGEWESAAHTLYDFIQSQRRDG